MFTRSTCPATGASLIDKKEAACRLLRLPVPARPEQLRPYLKLWPDEVATAKLAQLNHSIADYITADGSGCETSESKEGKS